MHEVAGKYRKFSPEFKDEAVKLVIEGSRPIAQVARELGINEGTLVSRVVTLFTVGGAEQ
jgi:transposase-like protein